ncbi:uncharacterized protein F4822DRAFT_434526 [Hypoxylon trugodes]|uniref:uncharacterized protein n=1 Tax=Hypoxylon trugodes TaxID=326681 RepID=UPI002196B280|nr:uncharacterized protein F4822DRAFT_434526 [Hypoxylon trugodes]KAI1383406.1 hypothetical protein F4822DRAFT_434526 [Hypoxylon trugodes]
MEELVRANLTRYIGISNFAKRDIKAIFDICEIYMAFRKDATVAQAVLAWGLQRGTIVIPKSVDEGHISENLHMMDVSFTGPEMESIAFEDKKARMNNPEKSWGVNLFAGLDDPAEGKEEL